MEKSTATRKPKSTASKTTTARKPAARRRAPEASVAPSPAPVAPAAEPVVVQETAPVLTSPEMKKVELLEKVVERSGLKKRDVKPAVEAALAVLGEALAEGRALNLRPLGKIKVTKVKKLANGQVLIARVRQPLANPTETVPDPLADAAE